MIYPLFTLLSYCWTTSEGYSSCMYFGARGPAVILLLWIISGVTASLFDALFDEMSATAETRRERYPALD